MRDIDVFGLELDEYLDVTTRPVVYDPEEPIGLQNDDEALWSMRRYAQAKRSLDQVNRQAGA